MKILIKYIAFHFQEYIAQITGRGDILQYLSVKSKKKKKKKKESLIAVLRTYKFTTIKIADFNLSGKREKDECLAKLIALLIVPVPHRARIKY